MTQEEYNKLKVGDVVRITVYSNKYSINSSYYSSSHNFQVDEQYKIYHMTPGGVPQVKVNGNKYALARTHIELVTAAKTSKEQFENEIEEKQESIKVIKEEISILKDKIAYLEEIGSDNYTENEFKAYRTLSIIEEGNLTKAEKAKKIAELIDNK